MAFSQIEKFPWRLKQWVVRQTIVLIKYCHIPNVFGNCKEADLMKTNNIEFVRAILSCSPSTSGAN